MATTTYEESRREGTFLQGVRWKKAAQAGLLVGTVLFLLSRGIPWVGSGAINPAVMGREIAPGVDMLGGPFFGALVVHLLLSVVYALILAAIVHGLRPMIAGLVGAVVGLVLYFMTYALWGMFADQVVTQREWQPIILHITFGLFVAEAYKGMAKRRPAPIL